MLKQFALVGLFALLITNAPTQTPTLADLAWMAGDWQTAPGGRRQIEEHWTQAAGASMMGMSRTVAGEKTVEFEYLRIEQRAGWDLLRGASESPLSRHRFQIDARFGDRSGV